MDVSLATIALNLAGALFAGAVIGAERTFNGRSAGFRTHALVALAAAGAATLAYAPQFLPGHPAGAFLDAATRLGQGVMTGVGFLGAGVIFKEGVSIQGLTTAAAVWATAAIGLLFGVGLWGPAAVLTLLVLVVLVGLRLVERFLPHNVYAYASFAFEAAHAPNETQLSGLLADCDVQAYDLSYAGRGGVEVGYRAGLVTRSEVGLRRVADRLKEMPGVVAFDLSRLSK